MPYYKWKGVGPFGTKHKGNLFAHSPEELSQFLAKREIVLHKCSQEFLRWPRPISQRLKLDFFIQLSELVEAGVPLADALSVIVYQTQHLRFNMVVQNIHDDINKGFSLSSALAHQGGVFDQFMIQIVQVGQESGDLVGALRALCDYLQRSQDVSKKIRSAALVPLLSFGFLLLIAVFTFLFVMPHFETIFSSMGKSLPATTATLIAISKALRSWYGLAGLIALVGLVLLVYWYCTLKQGKKLMDRIVLVLPLTGSLVRNVHGAYFFRSVAMLLKGGMQLVPAMRIAQELTNNSILKETFVDIACDVAKGQTLSEILMIHYNDMFEPDVIALIRVGQESGNLAAMLSKVADRYERLLNRRLTLYVTLLQPLLILGLGFFVALMIFAIYAPILQLSNVVA